MAPWKFRGDSDDPVEKRRRELADQQRRLAEQMSELEAELEAEKNPQPTPPVEPGPPVWRLEEEQSFVRNEEPLPAHKTKRVLRAQRQRDFKLFLLLSIPLALIIIWLVHRLTQAA